MAKFNLTINEVRCKGCELCVSVCPKGVLYINKEEANAALDASKALFDGGADKGSIPTTQMNSSDFNEGIGVLDLLRELKLIKSNGEGRRLIEQGGISIDDKKVTAVDRKVSLDDFNDGKIMIKKGKKVYHQIKI